MFQKLFKNILFVLNASFVFASEYLLYLIFNDYSSFIDRLTIKLSSINILYVKIFQAFALNNNFIDDATNNNLLKFTDNAPWNYSDINFKDLSYIVEKYDLHLEKGYEVVINAGMISLVFKASKQSDLNQKVIIKMKRKNIQQKLDDAIDNLLFLIYIL